MPFVLVKEDIMSPVSNALTPPTPRPPPSSLMAVGTSPLEKIMLKKYFLFGGFP